MKRQFFTVNLCSALLSAALIAAAQEHKHEEAKPQKDTVPNKSAPAKGSAMACCEKMGEMMHEMSGEMKAKMETMTEMKAKMAEKMKAKAGESAKSKAEPKSDATEPAQKNQHQH